MTSPGRSKKTPARVRQRDFPFVVQIVVPDGGFGCTLDAVNAWHYYTKNTQRRGPPQRLGEREFWSWCFEGLEMAKSFRHRFGGEIVPVSIKRRPERRRDPASQIPAPAKSEREIPERGCETKPSSSVQA
jgi:hypothetical protein